MAALELCCLDCSRPWQTNNRWEPCPSCGSLSNVCTNLDADDEEPLFTDEEADDFLESLGLDPEAFNKEFRNEDEEAPPQI